MAITPGTRLGRYEIRSSLGVGGMGEVYLAEDTSLGRKVALKLLLAEFTEDQKRLRRFEQEASAASTLNHPNILTIYEIGREGETLYIATEFIEGENLRELMNRGEMKLLTALDAAVQMASALSAAHAAGIVHRDVKPENVMVRSDGYVKVLDFGLAKLTEQEIDPEGPTLADTSPGVVMGTVGYMSPEQARGFTLDVRTDIFSFGVVLYEMIAGRAPFTGATANDVIASILDREPAPIIRYAPDVPAEFARIVMKALVKDREERYQTIKDVMIDLRRLKYQLEVETEIERSLDPESSGEIRNFTGGRRTTSGTVNAVAGRTNKVDPARTTSSAEYLMGGIVRHKTGAALAAVALVIAVVFGVAYYGRGKSVDSVAVLPFVNAGNDPEAEYLSDGITESIINSLSQLPNLRVMSRNSVFRYKGRETDVREIGRELGVRAVLLGRVVQRGDALTISVELVDAADNSHMWGDQYNRKLSDILEVQEEIAREMSKKLRLRLTGDERKELAKQYTGSTEAYQAYLKGRYYWNKRSAEDLKRGIEYYQQAITIDPDYALAYAGLANCYNLLPDYSVSSPAEAFPKAEAAARMALQIDDTLAEAHTALGFVKSFYDWDWPSAEREFKRAIELDPRNATAHQWYASYLVAMGRFDEAIAEMKRSQELEPLSLIINANLGLHYYYARRYDQAIEQCRKTLEMDQNFGVAHYYLGWAYERKGMYTQAAASLQRAINQMDDPEAIAALGYTHAAAGNRNEAEKILGELKGRSERRYVSPYNFAIVYAGLGDRDRVFEQLEKAYADRYPGLVLSNVDPRLDNFRADPRFADLLRRVRLAP